MILGIVFSVIRYRLCLYVRTALAMLHNWQNRVQVLSCLIQEIFLFLDWCVGEALFVRKMMLLGTCCVSFINGII